MSFSSTEKPSDTAAQGNGARGQRGWIAAVGALAVAALVLRLHDVEDSLFADEIYSYRIVANYGWLDIIRQVHETAITPPLHYLLAKGAVQFGEGSVWIRVPSIVLGTATVPVTYLLGLRTVGRRAALFGAAMAALSPFAVFYGTEARAYATMMFLCVVSTLALLIALDTGRRRWLVVYALAATLVLYAHYSGVFVVGAQALWAIATQPGRRREMLVASAAIALAYLPWLPSFLFQSDEHPPEQISLVSPVTLDSLVDASLATLPGRPFVVLETVPGTVGLVVIAAAVALALLAVVVRLLRDRVRLRVNPSSRLTLVLLLAVATPIGISAYSLVETSLFGPRNLAASLPAVWLLLGRLLTAPGGFLGVVTPLLVTGAVAAGTVRSLDDDYRRPPYRDVAGFVDARASTCQPVVEALWLSPRNALSKSLVPHLERSHPVWRINYGSRKDWRALGRSTGRLIVVAPQVGGLDGQSWAHLLGPGFELLERRVYPGVIPVAAFEYARSGGPEPGRLVDSGGGREIRLPDGGSLPVVSREGSGFLDAVSDHQEVLFLTAWAIDTEARRPARRLFVFDREGCLLHDGRPNDKREDVARAHGEEYLRSGFRWIEIPGDAEALAQPGRLRVFASSGREAWELPSSSVSFPDAR